VTILHGCRAATGWPIIRTMTMPRVVLAEDDVLLRSAHVEVEHAMELLAALSAREREVLALMAEGRSNAGIARRLWVTEGTVEKHVRSILTKLTLAEAEDDHRRVLAVLASLDSR
jgi:DNA-binding NarL/FixJ family response regulator